MSDQTPSELKAANTSLGDLLGEVTRDLSTLIRQEMALAKAELKESAGKAAKGAGMLGGAAYGAGMAVLFLSIALWWALGDLIGGGWVGRRGRGAVGGDRTDPVRARPRRTEARSKGPRRPWRPSKRSPKH